MAHAADLIVNVRIDPASQQDAVLIVSAFRILSEAIVAHGITLPAADLATVEAAADALRRSIRVDSAAGQAWRWDTIDGRYVPAIPCVAPVAEG